MPLSPPPGCSSLMFLSTFTYRISLPHSVHTGMLYPQAFCFFRDKAQLEDVLDGLMMVPKDPQYLRLACTESHQELSQIVTDVLTMVGRFRSNRLSKYLVDNVIGKGNAFVHLFSVVEDYGMLYHVREVKTCVVTFSVHMKVRPHAGAIACGRTTISEEEMKKRAFENRAVAVAMDAIDWAENEGETPAFLLKNIVLLDPTIYRGSKYKAGGTQGEEGQRCQYYPRKEESYAKAPVCLASLWQAEYACSKVFPL